MHDAAIVIANGDLAGRIRQVSLHEEIRLLERLHGIGRNLVMGLGRRVLRDCQLRNAADFRHERDGVEVDVARGEASQLSTHEPDVRVVENGRISDLHGEARMVDDAEISGCRSGQSVVSLELRDRGTIAGIGFDED